MFKFFYLLLVAPLLIGAGQPIEPGHIVWDQPDIAKVASWEVIHGWDGIEQQSNVTEQSIAILPRTGTTYSVRVRAMPFIGSSDTPSQWSLGTFSWPNAPPNIVSLSESHPARSPPDLPGTIPPPGPSMAITLVNSAVTNDATAATTIASAAFNATTGNAVLVGVSAYDTDGVVTGVTDTAGNTYVRAGSDEGLDATHHMSVWYALNITGNASNVVTATYTGSSAYRILGVSQFSGLATTGAYDQTSAIKITGPETTTHTSNNTGTTTQADELVLGWYVATNVAYELSASSPTVLDAQVTGGNAAICHKIVSTTGAQSTTLTSAYPTEYAIQVRTFKAATSGGATNQFAYPTTDTLRDNWEEDDGTITAIYDQIDEAANDDSDYIRTQTSPTSDVYVTKFGALVDPVSSAEHTLRLRYAKDSASGDPISLLAQLRQGYTDEGSPGTLIATGLNNTNVSNTWTQADYALSTGEADAITDYSDLYLRLVGNTEPIIGFIGAGAQAVSTTSGGTVTAAWPTSYTAIAGHVGVLIAAGKHNAGSSAAPDTPSGWTLVGTQFREIGTYDLQLTVWTRVLTAGLAATGITVPASYSTTSGGLTAQVAVFSGVDNTTIQDATAVLASNAAATTWTPTGITTVTNNAVVLSTVATADDNALNLTTTQSFTLRMSGASYDTTTGGDHAVGLASKNIAVAGAVTNPTWNESLVGSDAWTGITLALRPAVSARRAQVSWAALEIPPAPTPIGSAAGTSTVSGAGSSIVLSNGSSSGTSTVNGAGSSINTGTGSSSGTSTVSGEGSSTTLIIEAGDGSSVGTSTASGVGASTNTATGSSSGSSTANGAGSTINLSNGSSSGTSTVSGAGSSINTGTGSSTGSSTVNGAGLSTNTTTGSASGSSTVAGFGASINAATGSSSGTSATLGEGSSIALGVGSSSGLSTANGAASSISLGNGSSSGTSTTLGEGSSINLSVGNSVGTSTASGIGSSIALSSGSSDGTSTVSGDGSFDFNLVSLGNGSSSGTSTTLGEGSSIATSIGSSSGLSTVSGIGSSINLGNGLSVGTSTASGIGSSVSLSVGTSGGVSTASGIGSSIALSVGSSTGTSTTSGIGASINTGTGSSAGLSSASGIGSSTHLTNGASSGVSTVLGIGSSVALGTGSASGSSTTSAIGSSIATTIGTAFGSSSANGAASSIALAIGTASGSSTVSGAGVSSYAGISDGASSGVSGALGAGSSIATATGTASGSSTTLGAGASIVSGIGASSGTSTVSGIGQSTAKATGSSAGTSTASAIGRIVKATNGSSAGSSTALGIGIGLRTSEAIGTASGTSTVSGIGKSIVTAIGTASGSSNVSGVGKSIATGVGYANGLGSASGNGESTKTATGRSYGTSLVFGEGGSIVAGIGSADGTSIVMGVSSSDNTFPFYLNEHISQAYLNGKKVSKVYLNGVKLWS